jgi:hypothetical protein
MNLIIKISCIISLSILPVTANFGQSVVKIMPLGNSMTEGWMNGSELASQRKGYRAELKQFLDAAGYVTDFVGTENYGCDYFTDCQCAGIDGTRDQYLEGMLNNGYDERWGVQKTPGPYLDSFNPDIILLGIGTNDITHETDAITNQRVSAILDQIDAYEVRSSKEVIVFLSLIINRRKLPDGSDPLNAYTTSQWNIAINAMAQQRITNHDKLFVVDMENGAGFNYAYAAGDMYLADPEGLHPGPAGYTKMANKWFSAITSNYNTAPAITPIPNQSTNEGTSFAVLALNNYVSDIESTDQNISWTTTQIGGTSNLNIIINSSHNATVTPVNSQWNGSQTVVFTATDQGKNGNYIKSSKDTVVFTVNAVNNPPTVTGQTALNVDEDNPIALSLSDFTVFDPDSPSNTFQLVVLPGTGYSVNGMIVTPATNFNGNLSVNVAVSDNIAQGATYAANINVNPVNDPPVFNSQPAIAINEDESYQILIDNLNVTDPDNTSAQLTIVMEAGTNHAIEGNTIRPNANFNGTLQVQSYISDPEGAHSSTFYLQITVNPVDDLPVFTSAPDTLVIIGSPYIYAFSAVDSDITDVVEYSVVQKPDWLTYYSSSMIIAGVPNASNKGLHLVIIRASDGHGYNDQTYLLRVKSSGSGVNNYSSDKDIFIYPNPASHEISIAGLPPSQSASFRIYNFVGSLIYDRKIENTGETISINDINIQSGIYLYVIEFDSNTCSGKLSIVN